MKKPILGSLLLIFLAISGFSQNEPDYKDEMIESGEHYEIPEENKSFEGDYASFLKSKVLNSAATGSTVFINPKELGLSVIGGRVRASLVDKTNQIFLVAPSGGGLWKFNALTKGEFAPINDFGSFMAITDIAQNPFNSQQIIIGTGDGLHGIPGNGLFRSSDGGKTFSKINSTDPAGNSDFSYIRFVKFSPFDNKTLYLATNYKLYKTSDSGLSWVQVFSSGYSNIHSLDFLAGESLIIGVDDKGIFISPNGNPDSFNLVTKDLPNELNAIGGGPIDGVVAASYGSNRNIAYAFITGASNDVYKTTDNGISWSLLSKPNVYAQQTWFCLTIGVDPVNSNIVILGSVSWGYTTNGGTTWHNGADLEVDFHSVHFHNSDPNVAYLGYDQGLGSVDFNKYADVWAWNGSQYVLEQQPEQFEIGKNEGFNTSQVYYGDYFPEEYGDSYLQGQQDGGCFGKVNNNAARIVVGDGGSVFVNKQNPSKAFASTQMGNLCSTSSAIPPAYNYTRIDGFYDNHPNWITQFAGNNADGNQIYISDKTSIQATLDGGVSFNSIASHTLNYVKITVQNSVDPVVYAVGYNSTNGKLDLISIKQAATNPTSTTIKDILSSYNGLPDHIEIDPNDEHSIFLTGSYGNAYKISNINSTALTTKSIKGDIQNVVFNTVIGIKNKPDLLIAGTNIGLFYSTNSGANWVLSNELPYAQITDLKFRESDHRLFVFTYGRGSWAVTLNTDPELILTISAATAPANGGSVSGTGDVSNYATVTLVATAASGFKFVNWSENGTSVSTSASYSFSATENRTLVANFAYLQDISFNTGWNIFSSNVILESLDMKTIFQPLIDGGQLKKVMDESGKTIENFGAFGGWKNNIGNLNTSKGYKVNVLSPAVLSLQGAAVQLPFDVNLATGWNIISYPSSTIQDAKALVQTLIDSGKLKKVMDETGKTIENFGAFGGWKNNIGNFVPGKGYKVNVTDNCTLTILASGTKSAIFVPEVIASNHFDKVFTGNGTDHMSINLVNLQESGLLAGDEIGVFDGKYCVGSAIIGSEQLMSESISIPVSANDEMEETINGFTSGHLIELQLYRGTQTYKLKLEKLGGSELFEKNGSLLVQTNINNLTNIQFTEETAQFKCYPNPFTREITIEVQNSKQTEITVEIYNMAGQLIKYLYKGTTNGNLSLKWNGTNNYDQNVATGVYLCKVNGQSKQMIFEGLKTRK